MSVNLPTHKIFKSEPSDNGIAGMSWIGIPIWITCQFNFLPIPSAISDLLVSAVTATTAFVP